ncbi:MAG: hypothetical protein U1A27_09740 [Phycisphaerae bacterium]
MTDAKARDRSFALDDRRSLDIEEARLLRRRVAFWRSAAGLLLLSAGLVAALYQVRRAASIDRCRAALEHYARVAESVQLSRCEPAMLGLRWRYLDAGPVTYPATHFTPFVTNWDATPKAGEEVPLAICEVEHGAFSGGGRHELVRTSAGLKVRWVGHALGVELAQQAARAERATAQLK